MTENFKHSDSKLSVIIPCYNEARTLKQCVQRLLDLADQLMPLEIIIVDDGSTDHGPSIASELEIQEEQVKVLSHKQNQGKGAALRTGIDHATGDFIAIHDADLEYDPKDLKKLLDPLINEKADVVIGSRFLSSGAHRVLYFWHTVANRILTILSNMLTDLNLTDIECGQKVFRKKAIDDINIEEDRFGFEPEIIAKVAHKRLRIYEVAVSYDGRTYAEGKKIGWKDAVRAIYCILHYNVPYTSLYIQFFYYSLVGIFSAGVNIISFLAMLAAGTPVELAAPIAFCVAAAANYLTSIIFIFRHLAKWSLPTELVLYVLVVAIAAAFDLWITMSLLALGYAPGTAKGLSAALVLMLNFLGRRYIVFPTGGRGPWKPRDHNRAK